MARYHYSYLNRDYNPDVLSSWGEDGLTEAARRLGYRFVLLNSTVTPLTRGRAKVVAQLRNDGWAAPYRSRLAHLVLRDEKHTYYVNFTGNADIRNWAAGTTVDLKALVKSVPTGTYRMYLAIPARDRRIAADPRFAVRTANLGTWEAETGLNDLGQSVRIR